MMHFVGCIVKGADADADALLTLYSGNFSYADLFWRLHVGDFYAGAFCRLHFGGG